MTETRKSRIFVVDDEATLCKALERLLVDAGYHVDIAIGPEEAIRIKPVLEREPDLLLVDLFMPGMNGIEYIEAVKREGYQNAIMAMSGYPYDPLCDEFRRRGWGELLYKPFGARELRDQVRRALNTKDI